MEATANSYYKAARGTEQPQRIAVRKKYMQIQSVLKLVLRNNMSCYETVWLKAEEYEESK